MPTPPSAPSPDDEPDEVVLGRSATRLAEALCAALPGWVEACVAVRARDRAAELLTATVEAGEAAQRELCGALDELLALDIDEQPTTPLALLRRAVRHPTAVLRTAGIAPVARDHEAERLFPDDPYDITPATFGDFGPEALEAGLLWGAAKAKVHRSRHRGG